MAESFHNTRTTRALSDDELRERSEIRQPAKFATYKRLAERDGALCQHCGAENYLTIDHVDPNGGDNDKNLQLLCRACNSSKCDRVEDKTVRFASSVWQSGFTIIPNAVLTDPAVSAPAFRVYALLLKYARESEECWPGQDGLSDVAGLSERTIRSSVRELEQALLIRTRRRGLGQTNIYVILEPRRCRSGAADFADQERQIPPPKKNQKEEETTPDGVVQVRLAWKNHAPPLQNHRDTYYSTSKATNAIKASLKVYPPDDVVAAVINYATCLGSDDYRWSYSWPLIDFLKRGLDRFVPEAKPLERERVRSARDAHRSLDHIAEI